MASGTRVALLAWITLSIGVVSLGMAGEAETALIKQYWGKIAAVRVDRCGRQPGLCDGVIILVSRDGTSLALAIRPGTWIKRGDRLVLLEDLHVGNEIHVQAIELAGEDALRATTIEVPANR